MLDHYDDIVGDLAALHGVADWRTLSSRTFASLVERLPLRDGVVQRVLRHEAARQPAEQQPTVPDAQALQALASSGDIEWG